ncbi:hypothetical protein ACIHCQ_03965 [Streptomyces sp. NPDC052236]|uniref:hypothetical protein n=1 Tax=Streptomyces sp. NPDC052236 TaxID=3365686 RepID=UPI0037D276C1
MRTSVIRRTAVAASAVSLALLVTACGGEDSDSDSTGGKAKETAAAKPNTPAVKALTAAELEKAALVQGDVKEHKVVKAGPQDTLTADKVTVDKAACKPIAYTMSGVPVGDPAANVRRRVTSEPKKGQGTPSPEDFAAAFDVTITLASLSSYDGKGAEEAVNSLRTAVTDCASGFTMTVSGTAQKVLKMTETKASGGDEAVAWSVLTEADGDKSVLKLAVVRKGATLATFPATKVAALGTGKDYPLPVAVMDAQVAKLG